MAATDTTIVRDACEHKDAAGSGGVTPGQIKQVAGKAYIALGTHVIPEGDTVAWRNDLVVSVKKETQADTFAIGAVVELVDTTQLADAASGNGDYAIGKARKASSATDTHVIVGLNDGIA